MINPKIAKPIRPKPITAPESKATRNALEIDSFAACVVLTFPRVAIFIPIKPERQEMTAPLTNAMAVKTPSLISGVFGLSKRAMMATAITAIKIAITLYSRTRNAIAPSAMAEEIVINFSSEGEGGMDPTLILVTFRAKNNATRSARIDAPNTIYADIIRDYLFCSDDRLEICGERKVKPKISRADILLFS